MKKVVRSSSDHSCHLAPLSGERVAIIISLRFPIKRIRQNPRLIIRPGEEIKDEKLLWECIQILLSCTSPIYTSFVRKGRKGKDEEERSMLCRLLSKERSIRPEGSYGIEKNIINLEKSKPKPEKPRCFGFFSVFIWLMQAGW
jgi:hypothetical protein